MKKFFIALSALLLCVGILTGCDTLTSSDEGKDNTDGPAAVTPLEAIEQSYGKITEATGITQSISIVSGKITQYECNKTYAKAGSEYRVTGTAKRLNDITAETPYTETVIEETVAAGEFGVHLKFDELYYSRWTVENNTLTAQVSDNSVKLALGITGELPAPVHSMQMKVETDGTHVGRIDIGYVSGSSTVTIALTFTY